MNLAVATRSLLEQALDAYRDNPRATDWLHRHLARFDEPLRIAVVGSPKSGKSTLVDALAGESVTSRDADDDRGPAWYRVRLSRSADEVVLVDTPGLDADASPQAVQANTADADAVLFLARRARPAELGLLRTVHSHPLAMLTPVNSLVVLSRADELGSARVDALIAARQIARRFRREPEVRDVCQDVVAVAGLVACTGRTLDEDEFTAVTGLAELPRQDLDALLLSADRFVRSAEVLDPDTGARLLSRFGVFGLRLATTLARRDANTMSALSAQLVQRSGLTELRDAIATHFTERAEVLKARSALIALEVLLRMEPHPAGEMLLAELDRTLAEAHVFRELRLLALLRSGQPLLPDPLADDAGRLIGGEGTSLPERLGLGHEPSDPERRKAIHDAVRRWREHAENPVLSNEARQAAMVVLRSCEEMVAAA